MYDLITAEQINYTPQPVNWQTGENLSVVDLAKIYAGTDCVGSAAGTFIDQGIQLRNRTRRLMFAAKNLHTYLYGYVRVPTTIEVMTLAVDDIEIELPPDGNVYLFGGFTNIFHNRITITEDLTPEQTIDRPYNDIIRVNFSHDAIVPTGMLLFGAFYV